MKDALQKSDLAELFKAMAEDVGKEVAHHIGIMYPDAVKACPSTFLLSVRGKTYNAIMAWSRVNDPLKIIERLCDHASFRKKQSAIYRKIRRNP